jgi:hypothetical protein
MAWLRSTLICLCTSLACAAESQAVDLDLDHEWRIQFEEIADQLAGRFPMGDRAYHSAALIQDSDRHPVDVILRRSACLLADLERPLPAAQFDDFSSRLQALQQQAATLPPGGKRARPKPDKITDIHGKKTLGPPIPAGQMDLGPYADTFIAACKLNRAISLANPLLDLSSLVFVKRHPPRVGHMCDQWFGMAQDPGGGLYALDAPGSEAAQVRNLTSGTTVSSGRLQGQKLQPGVFVSPEVDYDGNTVWFAYSETTSAFSERWQAERDQNPKQSPWAKGVFDEYFRTQTDAFHLFALNLNTDELAQLTDGAEDDHSPCILPNGRLAFVSTRRGGEGRCHPRPCPSYVLHTMLPDGSDIQPLSYHEINEWTPRVNNDGDIVYSRWDYLDRAFGDGQHPWIMRQDGRQVRALYGNYENPFRGNVQEDLRAIPDSPRYVGVLHKHHLSAYGSLVIYDSTKPDDPEQSCITALTPELNHGGPSRYASPYPLNEHYFLCVWSPDAPHLTLNTWKWYRPPTPHGIYLIDAFGNKTLLYRDESVSCMAPLPLMPRSKPPVQPHLVAEATPPGRNPEACDNPEISTVAVMDVYDSELPWPEDRRITALRIIQIYPKSTPKKAWPGISYNGEVNARSVIGSVPVEADGSAYFTVPTRVPLYFQALDEQGLAIQSMRSSMYAMPGEQVSCQGCHEPKSRRGIGTDTMPLALQRAPSVPVPDQHGTKPLSFTQLIQPILTKKCTPCHDKHEQAPRFSTRTKGWQTEAYRNLGPYAWCYSGNAAGYAGRKGKQWRNCTSPVRSIPGKVGATEAPLYHLLTTGSHKDKVELSQQELRAFTTWLDCMSVFYGGYTEHEARRAGELYEEPALE